MNKEAILKIYNSDAELWTKINLLRAELEKPNDLEPLLIEMLLEGLSIQLMNGMET